MTASTWTPKFEGKNNLGLPLVLGTLATYAAGTSTPVPTYTNQAGNVANTNPVQLDAAGRADVWLTPRVLYKLVLKDRFGVTIWTADNFAVMDPQALTAETLAERYLASNGSSLIGFQQDGLGTVATTVQAMLRLEVNVMQFGGIFDGTYHSLSERFTTLEAARAVYPHASSLSDSIDWAAAQAANNLLNPFLWGGTIGSTAQGAQIGQQPASDNITRGGVVNYPAGVGIFNRPLLMSPNVLHKGVLGTANTNDQTLGYTATRKPGTVIIGRGFSNPATWIFTTAPYDSTGARRSDFAYMPPGNAKDNGTATFVPRVGVVDIMVTSDPTEGVNEVYGAIDLCVTAYSRLDNVVAQARFIAVARRVSFECSWGRVTTRALWGLYQINCLKLAVDFIKFEQPAVKVVSGANYALLSPYLSVAFDSYPADKLRVATGLIASYADTDILNSGQAESMGSCITLANAICDASGFYEERTGLPDSYGAIDISQRAVFNLTLGSQLNLRGLMSKAGPTMVGALVAADNGSQCFNDQPKYITCGNYYLPIAYGTQPVGGSLMKINGIRYDSIKGHQNYSPNLQFPNTCQLGFEPIYLDTAYPFEAGKFDLVVFVASYGSDTATGLHQGFPATLLGASKYLSTAGKGKRVRIVVIDNVVVPLGVSLMADMSIDWQTDYVGGNPVLANTQIGSEMSFVPMQDCTMTFTQVDCRASSHTLGSDRPLFMLYGNNVVHNDRSDWQLGTNGSMFGPGPSGGKLSLTAHGATTSYVSGTTTARFATGLYLGSNNILLYEDALDLAGGVTGITLDTSTVPETQPKPRVRVIRSDFLS